MELRIAFSTWNVNQKSLLLFHGQTENSHFIHDFFAVGIQFGFVLYFFNLGSGTRLLQSVSPMSTSIVVHRLLIGRHRRYAWLVVDEQPKVMGLAPGELLAMNGGENIFIGGHSSFNFTLLPEELQGLSGFEGCLLDIEARSSPGGNFMGIGQAIGGRSVQQCDMSECDMITCFNGGTCVETGTSFKCECMSNYYGPFCSQKIMPCSPGKHKCMPHAKCVPAGPNSYICHCPFGSSGIHCEKNIKIFTPFFNGVGSSMTIRGQNIRHNIELIIKLKPLASNGVLFYAAQHFNRVRHDFLVVSLLSGLVEYRFNLGFDEQDTVLISNRNLSLGKWHTITIGRYKRAAYLKVNDDNDITSIAPAGKEILDVGTEFFLGGIPESSIIPKFSETGKYQYFNGCMSPLEINGRTISFEENEIISGWNIDNCIDNPCICDNASSNISHCNKCICSEDLLNKRCDCGSYECHHEGVCVEKNTCHCRLGWTGSHCEKEMNMSSPIMFKGDSFIFVNEVSSGLENISASCLDITLDFMAKEDSGMILWNGNVYHEDDDYLGLGLKNGRLHLAWSLGWTSRNELLTKVVTLHNWHFLHIHITGQMLTMKLDNTTYHSDVSGHFHELNTHGLYHFGGFGQSIIESSGGFFTSGFVGCLASIHINSESIQSFITLEGSNVGICI